MHRSTSTVVEVKPPPARIRPDQPWPTSGFHHCGLCRHQATTSTSPSKRPARGVTELRANLAVVDGARHLHQHHLRPRQEQPTRRRGPNSHVGRGPCPHPPLSHFRDILAGPTQSAISGRRKPSGRCPRRRRMAPRGSRASPAEVMAAGPVVRDCGSPLSRPHRRGSAPGGVPCPVRRHLCAVLGMRCMPGN